jgi:hypothetical protein
MGRGDEAGVPNSGLALAGSSAKTSSAAPATWPLSNASLSAGFVDQAATGAVDDPDAPACAGERLAERMFGSGRSAACEA